MFLYKVMLWLAAAVLVIIIALVAGHFSLQQRIVIEVNDLFSGVALDEPEILEQEDIAHLPGCVQNWMVRANIVGREKIQCVRLKQVGQFRLGPDKEWMPFSAEEYFSLEQPAFLWTTSMKMSPLVSIAGRDRYYQGQGHMLIKLFSLLPVADETGKEIDQATLLRFLNEIMWFPGAAASRYISWDALDALSAKATISYGGVSASAVFYFNEIGDLTNMTAQRYRFIDGRHQLQSWSTPLSEYGEFYGIRVPTKGEGVWNHEKGDFSYIKLCVTDIEYNVPKLYK